MTERWTPPSDPPPPTGWAADQPPPWQGPPVAGPPPPTAPKPGIIPLRPLGVGEILDGAISAIRAHFGVMVGLSAVVAVVTQLVSMPLTWLLLHDRADVAFDVNRPVSNDEGLAFATSAIVSTLVQVVVTVTAALLLTGVLTVVVSRAVLGQRLTAGEAWERTRPRVWALAGVTLAVMGLETAVFALGLLPGGAVALAGGPTAAWVTLLVLGAIAGFVLAIHLYFALALAPVVVVLERAGVRASLRRSRELVKGAWWRTFGVLVLVGLIANVMAGILSVPFSFGSVLVSFGDSTPNPYSALPLLLTSVGTIIAAAITWPFSAIATTLVYVDRRMRREALDLELARAAGRTPEAPGPA